MSARIEKPAVIRNSTATLTTMAVSCNMRCRRCCLPSAYSSAPPVPNSRGHTLFLKGGLSFLGGFFLTLSLFCQSNQGDAASIIAGGSSSAGRIPYRKTDLLKKTAGLNEIPKERRRRHAIRKPSPTPSTAPTASSVTASVKMPRSSCRAVMPKERMMKYWFFRSASETVNSTYIVTASTASVAGRTSVRINFGSPSFSEPMAAIWLSTQSPVAVSMANVPAMLSTVRISRGTSDSSERKFHFNTIPMCSRSVTAT